jgi:hypothetical protein
MRTINLSSASVVLELSAANVDVTLPKNRYFLGAIFCTSDITVPSA